MARPATASFHGPFRGLNTDVDPRNLPLDYASDLDNVVMTDGDVTQRPGSLESCGGGSIDDVIRSLLYVAGKTDYAIAAGKEALFLQCWNDDLQPRKWTQAILEVGYQKTTGAMARVGTDTYIASGDGVLVYRDSLDRLKIERAGMAPYTEEDHDPTMADTAADSGISGTVSFWVSRYNIHTGLESNAVAVLVDDDSVTLDMDDNEVTISLSGITPTGMRGDATHVRIYHERADGQVRGLIAEIVVDETSGAFSYDLGSGGETNGGVVDSYDLGDDDTDSNYAPPTQNDPPPTNTVAMAHHNGRMFYATDDGRLFFSQSTDELQGHVEGVAATSWQPLPPGEEAVGLLVYREALYIFGHSQIYRLSGFVNSLTNDQVFDGTLIKELLFSATLEPVEGSVGCVSYGSIIEIEGLGGGMIFFAGPSNIYKFDGINAVPITENAVQTEYLRRLGLVGPGAVSAAHYKALNLVIFCFQDEGTMAYNYLRQQWVTWDTFTMAGGTSATTVGPITTRQIHQDAPAEPFLLVQEAAGAVPLLSVVFDGDLLTDLAQEFLATWTGPEVDLGAPGRRKRWLHMAAEINHNSDGGAVTMQANIDGQPERVALTDLNSVTPYTTITSAAGAFTDSMLGKSIVITGGTNFATGRRTITAVNSATSITVGAACATGTTTADGAGYIALSRSVTQSYHGPFSLPLGVRAASVQPHLEFAADKRTRFVAYSLDARLVDRR